MARAAHMSMAGEALDSHISGFSLDVRRIAMLLFLSIATSAAWAAEAEKIAMAQLRLTTESTLAMGCISIGVVRDDSVKDLRQKIVRAGGNTGVVWFGTDEIHAQVFRCPPPITTPSVLNAPPSIPPPPPGDPPSPPPGLLR